jgi:lipooligosaccharide transport system permease protein
MLTRLSAVADRTMAVAARNVAATRHSRYRWGLVSGFLEPLLYLLSLGVGVGVLVGGFTVNGKSIPYAVFVAPAMLASSAMSGAIAETSFRLFSRLRYQRIYDAVLATPVTPFEIVLGELLWAVARSVVYCATFLIIMLAFGLTTPGWALLALPATALIGFAFGGMGSALATFMRDWKDFDYLTIVLFSMFLFSGTFGPVTSYPGPVRIVIETLPLYHAVALVRGITTGTLTAGLLLHAAYLVGLTTLGLLVAKQRMYQLLLN